MESPRAVALPHRLLRMAVARGFSLVEMMVVLAIITIITTVTLLGHSNFDRTLLITDAAYTMALSVREMQTFGLSSRSFVGSPGDIDYGYGVNVVPGSSYVLYADTAEAANPAYCPDGIAGTPEEKRGNCVYDSGQDGVVQRYTLMRGFRIANACGDDAGGVRRCTADGYLTGIDVLFRRPDSDSLINGRRATPAGSYVRLTSAEIYLATPDGRATRAICISSVGQISVSSSACP